MQVIQPGYLLLCFYTTDVSSYKVCKTSDYIECQCKMPVFDT